MARNKVISADAAVRVILDGDTVVVGGFVEVGVPEELAAAGLGDRQARGLNHFARAGMVRRAIGGHRGMAPALGRL